MKFNIKIIVAFTLTILGNTACELTKDLDEFEPQNVLPAGEAVTDQESAELVLVGLYSGNLESPWVTSSSPWAQLIPSLMSNTTTLGFFNRAELTAFANNTPLTEGLYLELTYGGFYEIIARANWLIQNVEENTVASDFTPESRRSEILAEAKGMRALYHFYTLRLFGQFYDSSSSFGIDVRDKPALNGDASPRELVSEVYTSIHNDLDDAILNAPDLRAKYYVNKTFARALKAKVNLYEGNYSEAATLAKEVIDDSATNPDFGLSTTFEGLFDHTDVNLYSNVEGLLNVYTSVESNQGIGSFWWGGFAAAIDNGFISLASTGTLSIGGQLINHDNSRVSSTLFFGTGNGKYDTFDPYTTIYHLRMAEVYLIYAEAAARANGSAVPAEALQRLNEIRTRAGALSTGADGFETYPNTISYDEFLEAVRIEKMIELGAENGEEWFDLIRYDFADGFGTGFQVSDLKASATNSDKFILPIPQVSLEASGGIVVQNPSY